VVLVWAMSGGGYFWPVYSLVGLGAAVALHRAFLGPGQRTLQLRVDELTRTRSGALDVQAAQLRRIERDLHDGAQARLVALSMQLGRAEERLSDQPETAALVRSARQEATAAIAELRDLARGIAPPVLADRGLVAAVQSLASRSSATVEVHGELDHRLPPAVETAAYFVVAEALTNVVKHAPGAAARVTLTRDGGMLVVEVADNGPGGANPSGSGLTGLRQRVEALDGRLDVHSVRGEGTVVWAVLPCE
jgi:signal transduction histidine kinase